MTTTTMSEALEKSGAAIGSSIAYTTAAECLARSDRLPSRALPKFYNLLTEGRADLVEVVGETQIRVACMGYLERVASDMNNSESGGHTRRDTPGRCAPTSPKRGADGGHSGFDIPNADASTAPQLKDERGQSRVDARTASAPSSLVSGTGHPNGDAHGQLARPVREPSKAHLAAAKRAGDKLAQGIMDTFKITERQGSRIAVGDVKAHAWGRMARNNTKSTWVKARETELCLIMNAHMKKQAHIPKDADTRDIVNAETMKAAIAESAKIADYQSRITSVIQEIARD